MKRKFKITASNQGKSPVSPVLNKGAIEYNGYYIVEDQASDGYNVYDENFSLVDEGYSSLGSAKEFIEQLVENDPERIHCATEEDETQYSANMANGIQNVEQEDIEGEHSFQEDKCYQNVATKRKYSDYQMRGLFRFKEHHGYQGTYEDWIQEQLDSGNIVECSEQAVKASVPDYGGAFDIEPEQYFTREEINEVGEEVCERLAAMFNTTFKITDLYMDDKGQNNLTMEIESAGGETFFANLQIDRRWGKNPRTMLLKAVKLLVDKFDNAINQTSFELSSNVDTPVESAQQDVEGTVYHNRNPKPKRYDEDISEEYVETHLDAVILMDENGSWTYEDESYPWARSEEDKEGNWYANEHSNVKIADPIDVVEKVDELLVSLLPEDSGRYHIEGSVTLVFNLSGIEYDETFHGWSERQGNVVDRDYYTDDAKVEFNAEKSSIDHFQWKMVGPGEEVEVQAQQNVTAMKDIKYQIKYAMKDKSFDEICDYLYDEWQAGMLTEDEYYAMQGYAQMCYNSRQEDVTSADELQHMSHWNIVQGPKPTTANGYDSWTLLEKVGEGVSPRYAMYDNNVESIEDGPNNTFQLSKISPYDLTEYVWCRYKGGLATYYKGGKRHYSESFICDKEAYEDIAEWQNEVLERCLARLESFNSKLKSKIDHT